MGGINTVVISPAREAGGECGKFKLLPWAEATKEDIHVIHSAPPKRYDGYPKKIFFIHGTPEYAFGGEMNKTMSSSFSTAMSLIHDCNMCVTMHKRHVPYWQEFADQDKGKIRHIPSGIDTERWVRPGKYVDLKHHPMISYLDIGRDVKSPFQLLFAAKQAYQKNFDIRLSLWAVPAAEEMPWMKMITKMNLDKVIANYRINPLNEPDLIYRGSDLIVSNCRYGDITRVAMEAMACGCPTLIPRGDNMATGYYREGSVDDLAKQILRVLDKYEQDKEGMRNRAREISVKHYNIKNTVLGLKALYEELDGK